MKRLRSENLFRVKESIFRTHFLKVNHEIQILHWDYLISERGPKYLTFLTNNLGNAKKESNY